MRFLLKYIDKRRNSPLITDELWEKAKQETRRVYARSNSMPYVERCTELFEQANKTKYINDFKEYIFESSIEDFSTFDSTDVVVSTIHKAKGREFDDVYMLISNKYSHDNTLMRRLYVGMTRARQRLFIHTASDCFDNIGADKYIADQRIYQMPDEVVLQLSYKDVILNYFKERKRDVLALRGGDKLLYSNHILSEATSNKPIAMLSAKMQKTMSEWNSKGYKVKDAAVRFIVAWKPKDAPKEEKETAVLLADIVLDRTTD